MNADRLLHTAARGNLALNSARLFLTTPTRQQSNNIHHTTPAMIPRGDLRQRGDQLLVTRPSVLTAAVVLADALSAQLVPVRAQL